MLVPCYFIINDENPRTFLKFTRRNLYCLNIIRGLLSDWARRCTQSVIMYSVSVLSKLFTAIWATAVNIFKTLLSLVWISESYCPLQVRFVLAASNLGELSQTVGISSIYKKSKLVPRLDPFGTPHLLSLPLTKQVCFLFQRFSPLLCILKFWY